MFQTPLLTPRSGLITVSVRLYCEPWVRRFPRSRPAKAVDNLLGKEAQCSTGTPSRSQQTWPSTLPCHFKPCTSLGNQYIHRPLRQPRFGATQPIRCPTPLRNSCPLLSWQLTCQCRASPIQPLPLNSIQMLGCNISCNPS